QQAGLRQTRRLQDLGSNKSVNYFYFNMKDAKRSVIFFCIAPFVSEFIYRKYRVRATITLQN
ncbi:MAG: hypothetical protein B1H11_04825, partial [Desulfobacteraceae bacterium 4484_190.1]